MSVPSRVLFLAFVVQVRGQSAWQAGEPMAITIDYEVPSGSPGRGAAIAQSGSDHHALAPTASPTVAGKHAPGFSAASVFASQRPRGDPVEPGEAEIVLHVSAPAFSSAEEAVMLAQVNRHFASLKGLAGEQILQEDRALASASALTQRANGKSTGRHLRTTPAVASEPVAEAAVEDAHADTSRIVSLVADVTAGGYVARRALEQLVSLASELGFRSSMVSSGAASAAVELLKREGTDETNRALAGSLVTLLSDMPVAAGISNALTGSDGQVEIVLPRPSRVYGLDVAGKQL